MNLQPAEIDSTPVHKQYKSIIQSPIIYPMTDTPGAPMMVDYMGVPPSSGADLTVNMSEAPAPATSSDYADYMSAPPSASAIMAEAPPPDWAYSTPSSRMGAPR